MAALEQLTFNSPEDYAKLKQSTEPYEVVVELPEDDIFTMFKTKSIVTIQKKTTLNYNKEKKVFSQTLVFPTLEIPEGTRVHRADAKGATIPSTDVPAFFGNMKSIQVYSRGNPQAFSSYTFHKPCELIQFDYTTLQNLLSHPGLSHDDKESLLQYFNREEGYVNPISVTEENKKEFLNAKGAKPLKYLNRRVADILCSLGFDGWIVQPYNPGKRQGMIQYVPSKKVLAPYAPEFMLCKWDEYLTLDSANNAGSSSSKMKNVDGGRRKSRRSKKNRTKRSK